MALGPRLGADARLHVERGVGRIWGALGVGDDTELHLDPVGHWGPLPGCLVGRDYRTEPVSPGLTIEVSRELRVRASASPNGDPKLTHAGPARCPPERRGQVLGVEQQLLADDRRIRLDDERLAVDLQRPARAVGGRRELGDDRVEGRDESRPPQLVLEPEPSGGLRASGRRSATSGAAAARRRSPVSTTGLACHSATELRRPPVAGPDLPRRRDRPQRRGRGPPASSS